MGQGQAASRFLRVSEVAKMAGCSPDTVRAWDKGGRLPAGRTPGNQRRFLEADVVRFLQGGGSSAPHVSAPAASGPGVAQASPVRTRSTRKIPRSRVMPQIEPSLLEAELGDATAGLELLRIQREREAVARSMQQEAQDEAKRQEEERIRHATEGRLDELRRFGREIARDLPTSLQAQITFDLEAYVSPARFPTSLPDFDARAFVRAQVEQHCKRSRESEAQAAEIERRERAQVAEIERREQARARLIASGKEYASWEILLWGSEDKAEAIREVERELTAHVRWDWQEDKVKQLVDEILDDLCDEPGDDDDQDDDGEDNED